jgi:hypothetical protein
MQQSGFRPGHRSVSATKLVLDDVLNCLDHKKYCAALCIDLSKAFDTVDHSLLIQKLSEMGPDMESCKWFKNYLTDMTQCVLSDGVKSSFLDIMKGEPHGSVLGPVLFTPYINNIGI